MVAGRLLVPLCAAAQPGLGAGPAAEGLSAAARRVLRDALFHPDHLEVCGGEGAGLGGGGGGRAARGATLTG